METKVKRAKPTSHSKQNATRATISAPHLRGELALMMIALLGILALVASFQTGAMPVLEKVLPLVTLVFGYFFGQRLGSA
jgi:hypothetical protein